MAKPWRRGTQWGHEIGFVQPLDSSHKRLFKRSEPGPPSLKPQPTTWIPDVMHPHTCCCHQRMSPALGPHLWAQPTNPVLVESELSLCLSFIKLACGMYLVTAMQSDLTGKMFIAGQTHEMLKCCYYKILCAAILLPPPVLKGCTTGKCGGVFPAGLWPDLDLKSSRQDTRHILHN